MELILRTVLLIKVGILPFRDVWVRLVSICGINLKNMLTIALSFFFLEEGLAQLVSAQPSAREVLNSIPRCDYKSFFSISLLSV